LFSNATLHTDHNGISDCLIIIIITTTIISRTIFIVLSIRFHQYARVHFGSSGRKSVSAKWPPTRRPGYKLDLWVRLYYKRLL